MYRHLTIGLLLFICASMATAQPIDSLLAQAERTSDTSAFKIYVHVAQRTVRTDPYKALEYVQMAENSARRGGIPDQLANAYIGKGYIHNSIESRDSAEFYYKKAYEVYRDVDHLGGMYMGALNLGSFYAESGKYEQALSLYAEAVDLAKKTGDIKDEASALLGIGMIHRLLGNNDQAMKNYDRSLKKLSRESTRADSVDIANIFQNKANIHGDEGHYDKALTYNLQALEVRRAIGDSLGVADSYLNLSQTYKVREEFDKALKFAELALERTSLYRDPINISKVNQLAGQLYLETGEFSKALEPLQKAHDIATEFGALELIQSTARTLADYYASVKNYRKAYDYHKEFHHMFDSIHDENLHSQLAEMQSKYDVITAEKEAEAANRKSAEAQAKAAKADEKSARQQLYISLIGGAALILLIGGGFLIRSNRNKQRTNRAILHQKLLVEEKNREITDSINYAKRLQDAILPTGDILKEHLPEHFVMYRPKDIVSGDFYSLIHEGDDVFVAVVDCTGHGVPGAMMSLVGDMALKRSIREFGLRDPGQILDKMNEFVKERFEEGDDNVKDGMDMSLIRFPESLLSEGNSDGSSISFAGANNPLWIVKTKGTNSLLEPSLGGESQRDGQLVEIKPDKQPVGPHIESHHPFTTHEVEINRGDTIYIFSDGYADQFGGPKGKKFKYSNLRRLLIENAETPVNRQLTVLESTLDDWMGDLEQLDDICIIGVRL